MDIISPLLDSMYGLPTERRAVGTICWFTTCSLGLVGGLVGEELFAGWNAVSLALSSVGGGLLVYGVYGFFGFRAVARLAAFYLGAILGLLVGFFLTNFFGGWAFLLAPVFGVLTAVFRPFARQPEPTPPQPAEPVQPGEWRRREWG